MDFKKEYQEKIRNEFKKIGYKNPLSVPKIVKIVVNVGVGEAVVNKGVLEKVQNQIAIITGQKPIITKARKSVSAFKIRKGLPIGVKVTLRGKKMVAFLEKLVKIIIPRIKDFRGLKNSNLDLNGNLNIGFTEQTIFPEIDYDQIDKIRGLQVTVVTNARDKEKGKLLFKAIGIPFK